MKSLEIVNLKNKNITFIPQSLVSEIGYFIKYLYLDNNSIRILPDELFTVCTNLLWLDLRCNKVRQLPDGIKGHQNLQVLLLGKNDIKRLPLTLGSLPKLRELQVIGNPLNYPIRDVVKKGSKYLIKFLQMKWINDLSDREIIQLKTEAVVKVDKKIIKKNQETNTKIMEMSKMQIMEKYSWPMIFLTNWSSDRLVTDRDIRIKELERLYLEKKKNILEKQERIIQSYKNKETLKVWRNKAKQLQFFENSYKLNSYRGLEIPFGVHKEFSKMISRQTYRKECIENINYNNSIKSTTTKPFDFDLEMSEIYKLLINLTPNKIESTKSRKVNDSKTSNIDFEIQKLHNIQKRIAQLKTHII